MYAVREFWLRKPAGFSSRRSGGAAPTRRMAALHWCPSSRPDSHVAATASPSMRPIWGRGPCMLRRSGPVAISAEKTWASSWMATASPTCSAWMCIARCQGLAMRLRPAPISRFLLARSAYR